MRTLSLAVVITALCLSGCNKPWASADLGGERGRFGGIGIYPADRMWSQIADAGAPKTPAVARLKDDQQVIVVVDTRTGELRQCGNLSGFCVGMNPWAKTLPSAQAEPLSVLKHEEDFEREADKAEAPVAIAAKPKAVSSKP